MEGETVNRSSDKLVKLFNQIIDTPEWDTATDQAEVYLHNLIHSSWIDLGERTLCIPARDSEDHFSFKSWYDAESFLFDQWRNEMAGKGDEIREYVFDVMTIEDTAKYLQSDLVMFLDRIRAKVPGFPGVEEALVRLIDDEELEDDDEVDENDEEEVQEKLKKLRQLVQLQALHLISLLLKKSKESYEGNKHEEVETHLKYVVSLTGVLEDLPDDCGC